MIRWLIFMVLTSPLWLVEAALTAAGGFLGANRNTALRGFDYRQWLKRDLADCESILELGCGSNSPILQIGYGKKTDTVDIFEPYAQMHCDRGDYKACVVGNVLSYDMHPRTYDAVVMFDVLEHLDRDEVGRRRLFERMEAAARKRVIFFTPNGWTPNDRVDGNKYQEHKSAWEPKDYLARGYKVMGQSGWRWLIGNAGLVKRRPFSVWSIIANLTLPLVANRPEIAAHSYAVKEVK